MPVPRITHVLAPLLVLVALLGGTAAAHAQNTGGTTTKSLENRVRSINSLTQTESVETYLTHMQGFLAGDPTALVDVQFALPFSDAAVQAAVATTRQLLAAASADPLVFSGPTLTSSGRVLASSVPTNTEVLTGEEVLWVQTVELVGEELFHLNSDRYGCVAEVRGIHFDCSRDFGDLFVAAGDTVLLTSAGVVEYVDRTTRFTNTYLTTSDYQIVGTPVVASVPEPASAWLVGLVLAPMGAGAGRFRRPHAARPLTAGTCRPA